MALISFTICKPTEMVGQAGNERDQGFYQERMKMPIYTKIFEIMSIFVLFNEYLVTYTFVLLRFM